MTTPEQRRPRVWPVLAASAAGIAILLWLGFWQLNRLEWKEALLAQLAERSAAAPVGLAEVEAMASRGEDPEFTRVSFRATFVHDHWKKMIATYDGGHGWTIITPAVTADGRAVIVDRGRTPGQRLANIAMPEGEAELTGVIRTYPRGQAIFDPDNDPRANLWYWWDVPAMLADSSLPADLRPFPYVVQLLPESAAGEFPRPEEPKAKLANNHLGYAITWFGLALTLAAVAGVYVRELRRRPQA